MAGPPTLALTLTTIQLPQLQLSSQCLHTLVAKRVHPHIIHTKLAVAVALAAVPADAILRQALECVHTNPHVIHTN